MNESRLRDGLLFRRIADEGLLLDLEEDAGYRLNDVGMSIVSLLSDGVDDEALVERLCQEFEIDRDGCRHAVTRFVEDLRSRTLLRGR
jgi:hypothetical protein